MYLFSFCYNARNFVEYSECTYSVSAILLGILNSECTCSFSAILLGILKSIVNVLVHFFIFCYTARNFVEYSEFTCSVSAILLRILWSIVNLLAEFLLYC